MSAIPHLFERDEQGLYTPTLAKGHDWSWILAGRDTKNNTIRLSAWLDGQIIRVLDAPIGAVRTIQKQVKLTHLTPAFNGWVIVDAVKPEDKPILDLLNTPEGRNMKGTGICIGPDFNGNPHRTKQNSLVKLEPAIDYRAVDYNKALPHTGQTIFNFLKDELSTADCDIAGVQIYTEGWENASYVYTNRAKVLRTGFGLPWPIPTCNHLFTQPGNTVEKGICTVCGEDLLDMTAGPPDTIYPHS